MQNDFGVTLTNTAIYLAQSGKQDIENPSDMGAEEVKGVCQFSIVKKKRCSPEHSGTESRVCGQSS